MAHEVAERVKASIRAAHADVADVVVHVDPDVPDAQAGVVTPATIAEATGEDALGSDDSGGAAQGLAEGDDSGGFLSAVGCNLFFLFLRRRGGCRPVRVH